MKHILVCLSLLLSLNTTAFAMDVQDIKPHTPSKAPWSEQWFYYFSEPEVGYYKISFQTYIQGNSPNMKEAAYIHVAFAPIDGPPKFYDYFFDEVQLVTNEDPDSESFQFIVPDVMYADEHQVSINLPEFEFSMQWTGAHKRYWQRFFNPGEGPFGSISSLPFMDNRWFIYSMGTPTEYQFSNGQVSHQGKGVVSIDKGWYTTVNAQSFIYLFAADENMQLMFTGAQPQGIPIELWAGRYISENLDLTFYPAIKGLSISHEANACEGTFHLEIRKLFYRIEIDAKAPMDSFYISTMPTVDLLGATDPVMKSMTATMKLKVYKFGQLIEEKEIPQSFLEFGDKEYCTSLPH